MEPQLQLQLKKYLFALSPFPGFPSFFFAFYGLMSVCFFFPTHSPDAQDWRHSCDSQG